MGLEDRIKATAKNIEGKLQKVVGDITGNTQKQAQGKAKQAQAQVRHIVENVKDKVEDVKNKVKKALE
ncbi:MAG: CsbD family protein [Scytonema sp. RU_4_4]|nr:CsbD family protein [Scytonema sp. RU_4_4]